MAVSAGPSTSVALASSSAWVISRAPLSSAIAAKGHRRGGRRVVDRRDVEGGAGRHRRRNAVGHRVAERHRRVVVGRRRIAPGAVAVVDQRAVADEIARLTARERRPVHVRGVGQQLGLGDQPRAAVFGDRGQGHWGRYRG